MDPVLYDDGRIACDERGLIIRWYSPLEHQVGVSTAFEK
jgi:hypothetical protein